MLCAQGHVCLCVCVCVCARACMCVSLSLAVLCCHGNAGHMAQAAPWPSAGRVVLQEASVSLWWRNTHTHRCLYFLLLLKDLHTQANVSSRLVTDGQAHTRARAQRERERHTHTVRPQTHMIMDVEENRGKTEIQATIDGGTSLWLKVPSVTQIGRAHV